MTSGIDDFLENGFDLMGSSKPSRFTDPNAAFDDQPWYPCISNKAEWKDLYDDELCQMEKWLRSWIELLPKGNHTREDRKITVAYALSMMHKEKRQAKNTNEARKMKALIVYYSGRRQRSCWFRGTFNNGTVYTLSHARLKKLPFSLKFRLEELSQRGEILDAESMRDWRIDKKQATMPGTGAYSRYQNVNAKLKQLSEKGRESYNEYYREKARLERQGDSYISRRDPTGPGRKAHKPVSEPDYASGRPEPRKRKGDV